MKLCCLHDSDICIESVYRLASSARYICLYLTWLSIVVSPARLSGTAVSTGDLFVQTPFINSPGRAATSQHLSPDCIAVQLLCVQSCLNRLTSILNGVACFVLPELLGLTAHLRAFTDIAEHTAESQTLGTCSIRHLVLKPLVDLLQTVGTNTRATSSLT